MQEDRFNPGEALDLIQEGEPYEGLSHWEILTKLFEADYGVHVLMHLEKFSDIDHQQLIDYMLNKADYLGIAEYLYKFQDVDHLKVARTLIDAQAGLYVAKYLFNFRVDHLEIAKYLISKGQIADLAHNLTNFFGLDMTIAESLFNSGYIGKLVEERGLLSFSDLTNEFAMKLVNLGLIAPVVRSLNSFSNLSFELAEKLSSPDNYLIHIFKNLGVFDLSDDEKRKLLDASDGLDDQQIKILFDQYYFVELAEVAKLSPISYLRISNLLDQVPEDEYKRNLNLFYDCQQQRQNLLNLVSTFEKKVEFSDQEIKILFTQEKFDLLVDVVESNAINKLRVGNLLDTYTEGKLEQLLASKISLKKRRSLFKLFQIFGIDVGIHVTEEDTKNLDATKDREKYAEFDIIKETYYFYLYDLLVKPILFLEERMKQGQLDLQGKKFADQPVELSDFRLRAMISSIKGLQNLQIRKLSEFLREYLIKAVNSELQDQEFAILEKLDPKSVDYYNQRRSISELYLPPDVDIFSNGSLEEISVFLMRAKSRLDLGPWQDEFGGVFGGKKWGDISLVAVELWRSVFEGRKIGEVGFLIDRIMDLRHNHGVIFDKDPGLVRVESSEEDLLGKLLDFKLKNSSFEAHLEFGLERGIISPEEHQRFNSIYSKVAAITTDESGVYRPASYD